MQTDESTRASSSTASAYERVSAPPPPYSSGKGDAHQSELAELRDDFVGERLGPVELLGDGRDLLPREVADGVAEQAVLVGQPEVHAAGGYDTSNW